MAKKKRKTELTAEFWERDAAMRRALERRIAELESRKPPDQRLVPPR